MWLSEYKALLSIIIMSTETHLIKETAKWLKKAESESAKLKPVDKKGEEFAKNIAAYLDDCVHFIQKKDHVRAFEAVIWAWAWIEIGKDIGILK